MSEPSWRKPAGMLMILFGLLIYAGLVVRVADWVITLAWGWQAVFFGLAGVAWILPLGPVLKWMETGQWR